MVNTMARQPGPTPGKAHAGAAGPGYYDGIFNRVRNYKCAATRSRHFKLWKVVVDHVPVDAHVLEIGCGTGQLAELLHAKGVRRYLGFDFSPVGVEMARKRVPSYAFFQADARTTDLYGSEHNLVISTEVFEHLDDDLGIFDKLKPGTRILFSVPSTGVERSHVRYFESVPDVQAYYKPRVRRMKVGVINNGEWYFVQGIVR